MDLCHFGHGHLYAQLPLSRKPIAAARMIPPQCRRLNVGRQSFPIVGRLPQSTPLSLLKFALFGVFARPLAARGFLPPGQPRGVHLFDQFGPLRREVAQLVAISR